MDRLNRDIILEYFNDSKHISNLVYEKDEDLNEPFWWHIITSNDYAIYITEWFDNYEIIANIYHNDDVIRTSGKEPEMVLNDIKNIVTDKLVETQ